MDKKLIKNLLRYDFWADNSNRLSAHLFQDEIRELYEIIEDSHNKNKVDIPADAIVALWKDKNPVATRAELSVIEAVALEIAAEEQLPEELASVIIEGLWKRDMGRKIGNLGLNIAEGKDEAFTKLKQLLADIDSGFMPDDFPEPITHDIEELIALTSDANRTPFNIRALREKLYGPGPGDFFIIHARPETGKTAFCVSLSCGPAGFCEKGAKVLYLGNEEDPSRTMLRAAMAYAGMTKDEVFKNPRGAKETFSIIAPKMIMQKINNWDLNRVSAYIAKMEPDIVFIDQLDKVTIDGHYEKATDKLRELYTQARTLAGTHNCAIFAVSQTSAEGEGKTVLTPDMMENSKTGKFAEADVIIGVGKFPDAADGTKDPMRFLTIGKNKISGWHGTIACKIDADISRYMD